MRRTRSQAREENDAFSVQQPSQIQQNENNHNETDNQNQEGIHFITQIYVHNHNGIYSVDDVSNTYTFLPQSVRKRMSVRNLQSNEIIRFNNEVVAKAEVEELKKALSSFRCYEIKLLLSYFGLSQSGRKSELLHRIYDIFPDNFAKVLYRARDIDKNYEKGLRKQYYSFDTDSLLDRQNLNIPPVVQCRLTGLQILTYQYVIHPNIRLVRLPSYEILETMIKPSTLLPQNSKTIQESNFFFILNPQQTYDIANTLDTNIQIQLRCCLGYPNDNIEKQDFFPSYFILKVNNEICPLIQPTTPTDELITEPRQPPPKEIDITPFIITALNHINCINIEWYSSFSQRFAISVYLVRKINPEELIKAIKFKDSDFTKDLIKEKFQDDNEIKTTMIKVSLICPLGKRRIELPCRSRNCLHIQCFDAKTYILMNERKPTWKCPVCNIPANIDSLFIDGYLQKVLTSPFKPLFNDEIEIFENGFWAAQPLEDEKKTKIPCTKVEAVSDDIADEIFNIRSSTNSPIVLTSTVQQPTVQQPTEFENDIIDLTSSPPAFQIRK